MRRRAAADQMRSFWDARAREDALFFVDDRRAYGDADAGRFWAAGEEDLDALLSRLGADIQPADVVLDLGCGVGRLTQVIAARAAEVYGLDVSAEMLSRARAEHPELGNVRWLHGDGLTLAPLADASLDVAISHVVFQHIPDPAVTLGYVREIGRVLRRGGWAAFQISNDPELHPRRRSRGTVAARELLSRLAHRPRGRDEAAWIGSAVDLRALRVTAQTSGLRLERVVGEGTQFCLVLARRIETNEATEAPGNTAAPGLGA